MNDAFLPLLDSSPDATSAPARRLRIAVLQRANIADVRTLSGFPHFMLKALQEHVGDVSYLGPDHSILTKALEKAGRSLNHACFRLFGRHTNADHNALLANRLAYVYGRRLRRANFDVIFAPNASIEIAFLKTELPIVYTSDLTWANINEYYPGCSFMVPAAFREGERVEAAALSKASILVYSSEWSARSAIERYGIPSHRVHVIPFGANFNPDCIPPREQALAHRIDGPVQLLWIGVDWSRKGGSIARACLVELLNRGIDADLTVCGCIPPPAELHPRMQVIPFLDKSEPTQRARLSDLFLKAHFFVFPTRAEAFGIVICEASAHGLPTLAPDTGGIRNSLLDRINGRLVSQHAQGNEYADIVTELANQPALYSALVASSRLAYEQTLNWDMWGRTVKRVLNDTLLLTAR
jgi:glycosyltransferase involved in cell wall biosynthesis